MQTFSLGFTSLVRFTVFLLGGILLAGGVIGLLGYYVGLGGLEGLLAVVAVFYLFMKAARFSKLQANFSLTEEGLDIQWVKGQKLANLKNRQIAWSHVASYKLEHEKLFDRFVLKLHSGEKLEFSISQLNDQEDRFREFYRSFLAKVESLEHKEGTGISIHKAKTFYETTFGIVFILVLTAVLIGSFVYSLFFK